FTVAPQRFLAADEVRRLYRGTNFGQVIAHPQRPALVGRENLARLETGAVDRAFQVSCEHGSQLSAIGQSACGQPANGDSIAIPGPKVTRPGGNRPAGS